MIHDNIKAIRSAAWNAAVAAYATTLDRAKRRRLLPDPF
jgi:hypothetical protein